MPLMPDWDRLLANCPGAEDGFPPPAVGFGAIDVRRDSGFEATNSLMDLGMKDLTVDSSPDGLLPTEIQGAAGSSCGRTLRR